MIHAPSYGKGIQITLQSSIYHLQTLVLPMHKSFTYLYIRKMKTVCKQLYYHEVGYFTLIINRLTIHLKAQH